MTAHWRSILILLEAHYCRGNILHEMNHWQAALASYGRALALKPDHAGAKLAECTAQLPILYNDEAEIGERRAAYAEHLTALGHAFNEKEAAARLATVIGSHMPFYLAYQGYNDRDLQAQYGSLVCRVMAARYAPAQLAPLPGPNEPIRLGFVSGYFRDHAPRDFSSRVGSANWIAGSFGYLAITPVLSAMTSPSSPSPTANILFKVRCPSTIGDRPS